MYSNGNSFANGNSMDLSANSYGPPGETTSDGTRPASASWMFAVLIWRL